MMSEPSVTVKYAHTCYLVWLWRVGFGRASFFVTAINPSTRDAARALACCGLAPQWHNLPE